VTSQVVGKPGKRMVNFLTAEDYLFGDPTRCSINEGNEQGGIYSRTIHGFRFEEWPEQYISQMHNFYKDAQERGDNERAKFSIIFGPIYNMMRRVNLGMAERGNCSYWTSSGFVKGHILNKATMWPKYANMKLYTKVVFNKSELREKWEELKSKGNDMVASATAKLSGKDASSTSNYSHERSNLDHQSDLASQLHLMNLDALEQSEEEKLMSPFWRRSNFNIVTYRCASEKEKKPFLKGWMKPFRLVENLIFQQMDDMANIVVEIDQQEGKEPIAVPTLKEPKHRPFW